MKKISKKILLILLCALIDLFLVYLINYIGRTGSVLSFSETAKLPTSSFQGTIQSVMLLICIFLVFIDYEIGRVVVVTLISISVSTIVFSMVFFHRINGLPGIGASIMSLISVECFARFYRSKAKDSLTDYVTGLKNRRSFVNDIAEIQEKNTDFYFACFEIENFRKINDEFGLKAGDMILKVISRRINDLLGKKDILYRIGGSNFAVIMDGKENPQHLLESIISKVAEKITITVNSDKTSSFNRDCYISLIAGVSKFPEGGKDEISLLRNADIALSYARKKTDQKIFFYDEKMKAEQDNELDAESLIKESLEKDYFFLVYQPQFEISNKKLRGFETLIRCKKPDGSIVSPAYYIPVAEKSNLIMDIDDYVLHRAMKEFKPVLDSMKDKIVLSVNVSAKNISSADFVEKVEAVIEETKFPAECLEIEITEYSLAESLEITVKNINLLREKGIQIALDDFGTGYTSIAQLMNLPINLLKIDKSLIDDIENNQRNRDLVDSVIYMGHIMNCEVISEGVETEKQLSLLNNHKCDFVQGFVWGKPLPYADAVNMCR